MQFSLSFFHDAYLENLDLERHPVAGEREFAFVEFFDDGCHAPAIGLDLLDRELSLALGRVGVVYYRRAKLLHKVLERCLCCSLGAGNGRDRSCRCEVRPWRTFRMAARSERPFVTVRASLSDRCGNGVGSRASLRHLHRAL